MPPRHLNNVKRYYSPGQTKSGTSHIVPLFADESRIEIRVITTGIPDSIYHT